MNLSFRQIIPLQTNTFFVQKFCDIQQLTNIVEVFNAELGNGLMSTQDNSKLLKNSLLAIFFLLVEYYMSN